MDIYNWNDTIYKMNKTSSLKSLMKKLFPLWRNGNATVLMYTMNCTVGFSNFSCLSQVEDFIDNSVIDLLYIKTLHGEWNIYLDKYETYRFNKDNTLTIICSNKEYKIAF